MEAPVSGRRDLAPRGDLLDIARAVLSFLGLERPDFRMEYASEIPLQSGMAGSTALVVAMLRACLEWVGRRVDPYTLAETTRQVERIEMGVQCGYVDQYMCVFGGLHYVDFRGKGLESPEGKGPFATLERLDTVAPERPFVLGFTGVRHSSDSVHRPIRERWLAGETGVVAAYERVAEIGLLGKGALIRGDFAELGALMNENHAIQRGLGGSGPSNETLIEAALEAGALGAKLAGAGDGGTVVVLWPQANTEALDAALRGAGASALFRPTPCPGVRIERND
jgi:galactokinase/mevalonate kinase-like predicted kinase